MLNLGALLMAMVGYVRYLQLRDLIENNELPGNIERLNKISLITGVLAALGISIVGNFQEYNALPVHLTGAILAFGVGGVYASIQTYISFKIHPILGNKVVNWVRVILSASTFLFFFSTMGFAAAAYEASDNVDQIVAKWKHGEPGWELHFVSTASEWILAFSLISFLTTYTHEFKSLSWTSPSVKHKFK
ncbi:hypothetical protein HHI36_011948 [Cryptolaemus montrouzieri]|uniref:CWH43-like N-terminal domain-containing protein n=1 Tax=Cryptolaemus montrouzieri TaxID=559131 RepID=A0ABD2NDQ9_9CUCU